MVTYKDKLFFVRKHSKFLKKAIANRTDNSPWLHGHGAELVSIARKEAGYSDSTVDQDVYTSITGFYQSMNRSKLSR